MEIRFARPARLLTAFALMCSAIVVVFTAVLPVPAANADRATGGSARFKSVEWFSWGAAGTAIPNTGLTRTQNYTVGGQPMSITCSLSNIGGTQASGNKLQSYRSGSWRGDGLDDLYNIGGTGNANQLVVGLANTNTGNVATFNFNCSATLGGQPFPLAGLVMADAEASARTEYIAATIPTSATWRIMDRVRSPLCTDDSAARRTVSGASQTLTVYGVQTTTCESSDATSPSPAIVAFMEGATSATNVTVASPAGSSDGRSAIAVGVALDFDFGDAPASYGEAGAALQYGFTGGEIPLWDGVGRGTPVFGGLTLANAVQPPNTLGATVDSELAQAYSADARGDDTTGTVANGGPADENSLTPPAQVVVTPGMSYSLPITCRGTDPIASWIDFDVNGTFDADERSAVVACANGSATLTWTVPADAVPGGGVKTSFMRIRMVAAGETPMPTGVTTDGEVEDFRISLTTPPQLRVIKDVAGRADAGDQFTVTQAGPGLPSGGVSATTSGTQTSATTGPQFVQTGSTYTIADTMAAGSPNPLSDYVPTVRCVNSVDGSTISTTANSAGNWSISGLQNGQDVRCTVTNTPRAAAIDVTKTAGTSTGPNAQGQYQVTYQVKVTNTGAVSGTYGALTDTPAFAPNLVVDGATWTTSGNGAPTGGSATGAGPFTLAPAATTIGRDTTHTYDLTVRYHYTNRTTATACAGPGTGLYNSVALPNGQESPTTNNSACVEPSPAPAPALGLVKEASDVQDLDGNGPDAGDRIDYTFTVTNTGNVSVSGVQINDPLVTATTCAATTLAPGASTTCTGSYTLTLADAERGSVTNVATASGQDPQGGNVTSPPDDAVVTFESPATLLLDKVAATPVDANESGRIDAGDTIAYSFTVTNTGGVTINNVAISDDLLDGITCAPTTLAPGDSATCTAAPYTITQANVDAGAVNNTATANGTRPGGGAVTSNDDNTSTALEAAPGMTLDKQAGTPVDVNNSGNTDAGDTIAYTFTVTNTGNVTVNDVAVNDPMLTDAGIDVICDPTTLAPGESVTCTASEPYVVTAADVTAGGVTNTAIATGTTPGGEVETPEDSTTTETTEPAPSLSLDKQAGAPVDVNDSGLTDAGDTIEYTFTVTNTGNVPIRQVEVSDAKLTGAGLTITCPAGPLAPGASVTCEVSGPYVVTEADEAAGSVDNTATASGIDPDGGDVDSPEDSTTTPTTVPDPSLSLDKQAGAPIDVNNSGITDAGDTIAYTFTVTNTGNVPIRQVEVSDAKLTDAGLTITCPAGPLAPGASVTCDVSGPYVITAEDVAAGSVQNTATAGGTDPDGGEVDSPPDTTSTTTTTPEPSLSINKQAGAPVDVNNSGITDAGDTIEYTFTVTNDGNVPIRQVTVTDAKLTDAGLTITCPTGPLAPGESVTCEVSGPYVITAADVAAGSVDNTATASGTDPDGGDVDSPEDSTTTETTEPDPSLSLDKQAGAPVDVNNSGITDAGDTIEYTFTVTNNGNVPIRQVEVSDAKLTDAGLTITCPAGPLAPGESVTCEVSGPYVVTEADEQNGSVDNTATASGIDPDGGDVDSPEDSTTTPTTVPDPRLLLDKVAGTPVDVNDSGLTDAGDTIAYTFTVTNTGNVPIRQVEVSDAKLTDAGLTITCPAGPLAPGASVTCEVSGPYVVTEADEQNGAVENTATASGIDPDGADVDSNPDSTITPTSVPGPALTIDKEAGAPVDVNNSGITDAGDTITYTFTVTNNGNVPVRQITVSDAKLTDAGLTITCPAGPLAPGASVTCEVSDPYVVTEDDEQAGAVINTATASGIDPDGGDVDSPEDSTTTPVITPAPSLSLDKQAGDPVDVNNSGLTDAGDTIAYTFTVTNTGNVPIRQVEVSDAKLTDAGLTITCPAGPLAPGASVTCEVSGPYVVTEADEQNGSVDNTATASGIDPDGGDVDSPEDSTTTPTTVPDPSLSLDKQAGDPVDVNNSGLTDAGDTIAYTFTVTNTGNVPIRQVEVSDAKLTDAGLTITCPAGPLAPGASVTCEVSDLYVVTEEDEQAGAVLNTATAGGIDPDGDDVDSPEDSTTTPTTVPDPRLEIDKQAGEPVDVNNSGLTDAGDTIAYTFTVTNTGNVPIRQVEVSDAKLTDAGLTITCPAGPLAPGASVTCEVSDLYVVTEEDEQAGAVLNTATAGGIDPDGDDVDSPEDTTTTPTTVPDPSLSLDKQAGTPVDVNESGITDAGDTIEFTFIVTNDGNVPVRQITVTDDKLDAAGLTITCPPGPLAPGESVTCDVSEPYVVTEEDEQAGAVLNTATAGGIDPDEDVVESPEDSTSTPAEVPNPTLGLVKQAAAPVDANADGRINAGDTVTFTFVVTNTGNVVLTEITVTDPMVGEVTCPEGALAPGESVTCTAPAYVLTQEDMDAGVVTNTATAGATDPDGGDVVSPPSTTATPLDQVQSLALVKSAHLVDGDGDGVADAGETINYTFTVTNTGTVRITNLVIKDPMLAGRGVSATCPVTTLNPGESTECTAAMTVTAQDQSAGTIVNVATAGGTGGSGTPVDSDESEAEVPVGPMPSALPTTSTSPSPTPSVQPTATTSPSPTPTKKPTPSATVKPTKSATPTPVRPTPNPPENHGPLPNTGGPQMLLLAGGAGVLLIGLVLLVATRRRKES